MSAHVTLTKPPHSVSRTEGLSSLALATRRRLEARERLRDLLEEVGLLHQLLRLSAQLLKLRVLADLLDVLLHRLLELRVLHHRLHARLRLRVLQLLERLAHERRVLEALRQLAQSLATLPTRAAGQEWVLKRVIVRTGRLVELLLEVVVLVLVLSGASAQRPQRDAWARRDLPTAPDFFWVWAITANSTSWLWFTTTTCSANCGTRSYNVCRPKPPSLVP